VRPRDSAADSNEAEVTMASSDVGTSASTEMPEIGTIHMKLEVVTLPDGGRLLQEVKARLPGREFED
jgi:hypothetical protein